VPVVLPLLQTIGSKVSVECAWSYFGLVVGGTILIRVIMCGLRACEIRACKEDRRSESLSRTWWTVFLSRDSDADLGKDFFAPTITGSIELAVFPLLIVLATWSPIAWWLTIKTAVQWERWKRADRTSYNRFVVGNALVIGASVFLTHLIKIQLAFLQDFAP